MSNDTKVFELLASELQTFIKSNLDESAVNKLVDDKIAAARLPRPIELRQNDVVVGKVKGRAHKQFDQLTELLNEGHQNILMVGPAGCGKTTLAKSIAEALSLDFGFLSLSAGVSEVHLTNLVYDPKAVKDAELEADLDAARETTEVIPDYAFDCHTVKGKQAGMTKEEFFKDEFAALQPREPGLFDEYVEDAQ